MTRVPRNMLPQLSESWASMSGSHEDVESIDSEEDFQPRLREAYNESQKPPYPALRNNLSSSEYVSRSRQDPATHSGLSRSEYSESPRRRVTRATSRDPDFVMPSVDNPDGPSPRRAMRKSGVHRSTPIKRANPSDVQPSRRGNRSTISSQRSDGDSYPQLVWANAVLPVLEWLFSIIFLAITFLKPILTYVLAIWLLVGAFIFARNLLFSSVNRALTPLCRIPGVDLFNLSICHGLPQAGPAGPVEFDKLISAQAAFEDVLTTSAGGASLPLAMKHSEASIRDLRQVVEHSSLPSKHELVFEFTGFIDTAREASADLAKYNARIGRAVDRIVITNRWTVQVLEGIDSSASSQGSLSRFFSNLNVFAPFQPPSRFTQDMVFDQYIQHTSAIEEQIRALILEAEALLRVLDNLDSRLDLIGAIALRDGLKAQGSKDELLSFLWTKLGGNRNSVAKLEGQLAILGDATAYRKTATAHVAGTVVKLQQIAANLEDLRERVAVPEVVGGKAEEPLQMQIEMIMRAVDRLEDVRMEGRKIEAQRLRNILNPEERRQIGES